MPLTITLPNALWSWVPTKWQTAENLVGLLLALATAVFAIVSVVMPAGGVWVFVTVITGWLSLALILHGLFSVARRVVGPSDSAAGRGTAVVMSLLLAFLVSQGARDVTASAAGALLRVSFQTAPQIQDLKLPKIAPSSPTPLKAGAIPPTQPATPPAAPAASSPARSTIQASAGAASASSSSALVGKAYGISKLFEALTAPSNFPASPPPSSWLLFLSFFFGGLFLARVLNESRGAMEVSRGSKFAIMNYTTWIAFCIYAAILTPAAYFSTGALLFLDQDKGAVTLGDFQARLDAAEESALGLMTGLDVKLEPLATRASSIDAANPLAPLKDQIISVTEAGRTTAAAFPGWRANYERTALTYASVYQRVSTPEQFSDYAVLVPADYRDAIVTQRTLSQRCLMSLAALEVATAATGVTAEAVRPKLQKAEEDCKIRPVRNPPAAVICQGASGCRSVGEITTGASSDTGSGKAAGKQSSVPAPLHIIMWGWLSDAPQETVLIVGLIGFGLFGATIRMMGRPDEVPVTPVELENAKAAAETKAKANAAAREISDQADRKLAEAAAKERQARSSLEDYVADEARLKQLESEGLTNADPAFAAKESALKGRNRSELESSLQSATTDSMAAKSAAAEARALLQQAEKENHEARGLYHAKLMALTNQRTNIVIDKPPAAGMDPANAKTEYVISAAPARVLVHGLGAAFTVFLGGQTTVKLLSEDGGVSPKALLLACFVGAVFAEEIWAGARNTLSQKP